MMRKTIFSFWSCIFLLFVSCQTQSDYEEFQVSGSGHSSDVSIEIARMELEQLLDDVYGKQSTRVDEHGGKIISTSYTHKELVTASTRSAYTDTLTYYIFNFRNKEGYAIMSGDSKMPSLIALVESGECTNGQIIVNPGSNLYFKGFNDLPKNLGDDGSNQGGDMTTIQYGEWKNTIIQPEYLCKVKWGQKNPYNDYCPKKDGQKTATGCVATACAQLMSIYQYPSQYNGYTFDWEAMTDKSNGEECTVQAKGQIARLMQQLGLSKNLNMTYGVEESSANPENISRTLRNFGYSNGGTLVDYNTDKVVSELEAGFPVLVGGKREKNEILGYTYYSGGHRWLCYGLLKRSRELRVYDHCHNFLRSYEEVLWYPFCNWGWEGSGNGYYLSNAFEVFGEHYDENLSLTNYEEKYHRNYQYNVTSVVGIRK